MFEQLRRVRDQLDKGDALTLIRLDRLTGSTCELLNTLATIAKGAGFRLLYDTRSDTTTAHGRLMLKRKTAGGDDDFFASLVAA